MPVGLPAWTERTHARCLGGLACQFTERAAGTAAATSPYRTACLLSTQHVHSPLKPHPSAAYYKQIDTKHFLGADEPLTAVPARDPDYLRLPWGKMGNVAGGAALLLGPLAGALLVGAAWSYFEAMRARARAAAAAPAAAAGRGAVRGGLELSVEAR